MSQETDMAYLQMVRDLREAEDAGMSMALNNDLTKDAVNTLMDGGEGNEEAQMQEANQEAMQAQETFMESPDISSVEIPTETTAMNSGADAGIVNSASESAASTTATTASESVTAVVAL